MLFQLFFCQHPEDIDPSQTFPLLKGQKIVLVPKMQTFENYRINVKPYVIGATNLWQNKRTSGMIMMHLGG